MNWRGVWHLGSRYLSRNRWKTALLVSAFTLVWLMPVSVWIVIEEVERHMRARAVDTPLLLGRAGSPLELVFNGVYFTKPDVSTFPLRNLEAVREDRLAEAIPLYARFTTNGYRIVGTELDYFRFRDVAVAEGRQLARLGECVIGSRVARELNVKPGDFLISSPEKLFDLAGVYPLRMTVCGVLAPTGTADDKAVFVDLKTAWIIQGIGHGHDDAAALPDEQRLQAGQESGEENGIVLNASILEYNEITEENIDSFHFHGDLEDNPVTAAIVIPRGEKAQAMLKARLRRSIELQLIQPEHEMAELFATVFGVRRVVTALLAAIGTATLAMGGLVLLLSHRIRSSEFASLKRMGADFMTVRALVLFEAAFAVLASALLAGACLLILRSLAPAAIRWIVG